MNNDKEFLVQRIRAQYTEPQRTDLEALDAKVKRPAYTFAYIYGSISAVIMGAGMSLVMTDIGAMIGLADGLVPGIVTGIAGLCLALTTYPIHKRMLNARKQKYADQILSLSEKILHG